MITKNKLGIEVGRIYKPKKIKRLITEEQKNRVAHLDSRLQPDPNWKKGREHRTENLSGSHIEIDEEIFEEKCKGIRSHNAGRERHDIFNKYGVKVDYVITQDDLMIVDQLHGSIERLAGVIEDCQNSFFEHFENEPVMEETGMKQHELLDQAISNLHEAQSLLIKYICRPKSKQD